MYDIECLFIIKENSAGCLGWVRPMCGRCCLLVLFQLVLFVMLWTQGGGMVQAVYFRKAPHVRASSYSFSFLEKYAIVYVKASRMLNHACNGNVLEPNL